jgi:hypothetical protein
MKNPSMSMWLSAANAWAGAARSFWTAEMHRQQTTMLKELTQPTKRSPRNSTGAAKKRTTAKRRSGTSAQR